MCSSCLVVAVSVVARDRSKLALHAPLRSGGPCVTLLLTG